MSNSQTDGGSGAESTVGPVDRMLLTAQAVTIRELRAALEAAQGEIKRLTAWTDEDAEEWQKPMSYTAARAENKRLQSTVDRLTREKEALEGQLAVAERLIEVVRAREIGTAGGVGVAFAAYDALEGN